MLSAPRANKVVRLVEGAIVNELVKGDLATVARREKG